MSSSPPAPDRPEGSAPPPHHASEMAGQTQVMPAPGSEGPTHRFPAPRPHQGPARPPQIAPPPGPDAGGPKGPHRALLVAGVAVLVVLLFMAGTFLIQRKMAADAARRAEEARVAEHNRQVSAATTSVRDYLTAVAAGDAAKALGYAVTAPTDGPLLTPEVATQAAQKANIHLDRVDNAVVEQDPSGAYTSGTVAAAYTINGSPTTQTLNVTNTPQGWKLDRVTGTINLGSGGPDRTVFGTKVSGSNVEALPGTYTAASASPLIEFTAADVTVEGPSDTPIRWRGEAKLTQQGKDETLAAAKGVMNECLKSKELNPPSCPFIDWREVNGIKINLSTIKYTVKNDPWANADFKLSTYTMAATATVSPTIEINAAATQNGRSGTVVESSPRTAVVTAKYANDGKPTVSFR